MWILVFFSHFHFLLILPAPENFSWVICYPEELEFFGTLNFVERTTVASGFAFQSAAENYIKNPIFALTLTLHIILLSFLISDPAEDPWLSPLLRPALVCWGYASPLIHRQLYREAPAGGRQSTPGTQAFSEPSLETSQNQSFGPSQWPACLPRTCPTQCGVGWVARRFSSTTFAAISKTGEQFNIASS